MTTVTQKVDVLEVIKDAIKRTSPTTHFNERANLWAAHDAVAELIEVSRPALNELRAYISDCESYEAPELVEELVATTDRFEAALARVGGA